MSQKTSELQKEQFRKYLKKSGVIDQITLIITRLYEEKQRPLNVIEFIKSNLGLPDNLETEKYHILKDNLQEEIALVDLECEQTQKELEFLKHQAAQYSESVENQ